MCLAHQNLDLFGLSSILYQSEKKKSILIESKEN